MPDISLCALTPKPLPICANCRRNPDVTEPDDWQDWIFPPVFMDGCDHWIPTSYKTLAEVREEFECE